MIWAVARREFVVRTRSKGFLAVTGLLFVAVIGVAVAASIFGGDRDPREVTIGVVGDGVDFAEALGAGDDVLAPSTVVVESTAEPLERGHVDVVFAGAELTWEGEPDYVLDDYIRSVVQQATVVRRAEARGLGAGDLQALFAPVEIDEVRLDGGDDVREIRLLAAAATGFSTFVLLQVWGSFLMMGVIEEKSSKVVEVLLSHIRPSTLLAGKVIGLGALAILQMLIVVFGLVLGLSLVDDVAVPAGVWGTVPLSLATFLLGFGFYAAAFAAVGSTVSRQEDAQTAQLPAMLPLILGYVIAVTSIGAPDNLAVRVGSFVPFTSPVLLPFRTAMTDIEGWEVALSLALLAVSIVAMLRVAGRIYRNSLLRGGTRVRFGDAWGASGD